MDDNLIREALYNLTKESGASVEYGKGILVGVVTATMASNPYGFTEALQKIKSLMPFGYREECIPDTWREQLLK